MNNRTVNNRVNVQPECGPSHMVQESQTRLINQALNRAAALPNLKTVNTDLTGNKYTIQDSDQTILLTGSSADTVTFPSARSNPNRIVRLVLKDTSGPPTLQNVETDSIEALPSGATSAVWQSDGLKTWRLVDYTNATSSTTGVTSLDALTGAIILAATDNCVLTILGNAITIDGRVGPRFGYRWPANGSDITIVDTDYGIYGTSGQHCANVTFPLAADYPGKVVRFTFPPSGSLIASGSDTVDTYSGQTAEYQSDGVSAWRRMWSV